MTLDPKILLSDIHFFRRSDLSPNHGSSKGSCGCGAAQQDDFLPSVRQVAKDLEVNPMTVSKAYSLLEKESVLETVRGQGMRVIQQSASRQEVQQRQDDMEPLLKEIINKAKQSSLDEKNIIELIQKLWKAAP